jgi:protein-disulfide isomerase
VLEKYPGEVKLVIKHFPLPNHRFAEKAAIAAMAANRQGKFWEFHNKLFANQASLNDAKVQEIARELGLDLEKFNQDLSDPQIKALIEREIGHARQADIRAVPSLFINGKLLTMRGAQEMQQAVQNELRKKK